MCLAAPGQVVHISGKKITVNYPSVGNRQAIAAGVQVKLKDWVMVQMGVVTKVLTPEESKQVRQVWDP